MIKYHSGEICPKTGEYAQHQKNGKILPGTSFTIKAGTKFPATPAPEYYYMRIISFYWDISKIKVVVRK